MLKRNVDNGLGQNRSKTMLLLMCINVDNCA